MHIEWYKYIMIKTELDYDKTVILQISNDAFFYITKGESPLDEDNLEEARKIISMFPNGFYMDENYAVIKNSNLVEVTVIPYKENIQHDYDYDEYLNLTTDIQLRIKWLDDNHIKAYMHNIKNDTGELYGEFKVYTNKYGHKCFNTNADGDEFICGKHCLYFLQHFKKK